jgi:hypothetical protein
MRSETIVIEDEQLALFDTAPEPTGDDEDEPDDGAADD